VRAARRSQRQKPGAPDVARRGSGTTSTRGAGGETSTTMEPLIWAAAGSVTTAKAAAMSVFLSNI
jgi:hypothetical protein